MVAEMMVQIGTLATNAARSSIWSVLGGMSEIRLGPVTASCIVVFLVPECDWWDARATKGSLALARGERRNPPRLV